MSALSLIRWSLIFALFTLPLIFLPQTYLSFELPKVLLFYCLISFSLVGLIISKPKLHKLNLIHLFAILFFVWLFLASVIGVNFEHSFWGSYFRREGIITWIGYLVLFIAAGIGIRTHWMRKHLSWVLVVSSSAVALLGLIQFISLWGFGYLGQLLYSGRIISTFGQPNFLGAFLVMSLPLFWYLYLTSHKKSTKKYLLSGAILVILAIIFTLSRSAVLALVLLLSLWGMFHPKGFVVSVVGVTLLIFIFSGFIPGQLYNTQLKRLNVDLQKTWTAENRTLIAQKSIDLIGKRPITGYGVENLILAFPTVVNPGDLGLRDIVVDSAHNLFLDIGVESGLVGIVIFLALLGSVFIKTFKNAKRLEHTVSAEASTVKEERFFTQALIGVILAFLISHQFSVLSVVPLTLFWLAVGALAGPALSISEHKIGVGGKIILISVLGLVGFFVIQNIRADATFKKASGMEVGNTREAIKLDNQAISNAPWVLFYGWRRDFLKKQLGQ